MTQAAVQQQPPLPVTKTFSIRERFGVDVDAEVEGYDRPWNHLVYKTPAIMPGYKWREDLLRDLLLWWYSGDRALKLIGQTGTGKTELIKQFCAHLNLPLLMTVGSPRTEAYQLIGGMVPSAEGVVYRDAVLGIAARYGVLVMIDEYNVIDPGEATGLNAFLEGNPYTIADTGETLVPHPDFRIVVTQNPKSPGYKGRNTQDLANDDRFIDLVVPYMPASEETRLVEADIMSIGSQLPAAPSQAAAHMMAENFVKFANAVRERFMGTNDGAGALPCTMSTRTLRRWVNWTMGAAQLLPVGHSAAHFALRRVLTNRQAAEVADALHKVLEATTGEKEAGT
jgi:cobaltochelatase CobS